VLASFSLSLPWLMGGYSLITGLGFGLMYIPAVVAVASYFTRRRALATSICVCGTGFGTFMMPPLVQFLLENYGWRWTFRWLSCICLACVLCGAVMLPVPASPTGSEEVKHHTSQGHKSRKTLVQRVLCFLSDEDLVMSPRFCLFMMALTGDFLATMSLYIPYTHLPRLAESRGVPPAHAAFLISAAGVSNTLGRVLSGWISDRRSVHPLHLTLAVTGLATVPIFILPW
jgi:MFS family permease